MCLLTLDFAFFDTSKEKPNHFVLMQLRDRISVDLDMTEDVILLLLNKYLDMTEDVILLLNKYLYMTEDVILLLNKYLYMTEVVIFLLLLNNYILL